MVAVGGLRTKTAINFTHKNTMDIEQLKLIIETLGAAGEGARDIAMWYVIAWCFIETLTLSFMITFLALAYKIAKPHLDSMVDNVKIAKLRAIVCPNDNYGGLTTVEYLQIKEACIRGMQNKG